MFYDRAKIKVQAGKGGNGCASFRREKFVAKGGPDGGDGGDGGDVVIVASRRLRDLAYFQHKRHFRSGKGRPGEGARKHGRRGDDLEIEVPCGTQVLDEDGMLLADLVAEGQRFLAAHGGSGGRGNSRFATSTRRAPKFAELGLAGEERNLSLELKLLADAGLLGFPNAGKSSLLRRISRARPKVADYPFTTIAPMLGTVEDEETHQQFTVVDIPGLLEGASRGVGLGDEFLIHLERTGLLIHLLDVTGYYQQEPLENFIAINRELQDFSSQLAARAQLVAVNKVDLVDSRQAEAVRSQVSMEVARRCKSGDPAFAWLLERADGDTEAVNGEEAVLLVSAATGAGLEQLMRLSFSLIQDAWEEQPLQMEDAPEGHKIYRPGVDERWQVEAEGDHYRVRGEVVERIVARTDFVNEEAVAYLQERLEKLGVSDRLRAAGAQPGDDVVIGDMEFEFW